MVRLIGALVSVCLLCAHGSALAQTADPRPLVAYLGPMTGQFETLGLRAWQAVTLAARGGDTRLLRFDTNELGATAAYEAAVAEGAHAVIGPIGEEESLAVAAAAAAGGPPVFLLTGVHAIERHSARVFRLRTSPHDQAEALAGAALAQEPGLSFAVLAPDDTYGDEAVEAFVAAASRYGGQVIRVVRYEAGEPDVSEAVSVLAGANARRLRVPADPWRTPPETTVRAGGDRTRPDALFIPDFGAQVASVLPHLQYHRWVENTGSASVTLLGLSGWVSTSLRPAADLAASAIVTQVFDPDSLDTAAEAFALEWGVRFGEEPTAFEAQVFDGASLVFTTLRQSPSLDPEDIALTALDIPPVGGVCGEMWFDTAGGIVRQIGLWQVDGAGLVYPIGRVEPPRDRVPR